MGASLNGGTQKWMVFVNGKTPSFEMDDDWGYPVMTMETPKEKSGKKNHNLSWVNHNFQCVNQLFMKTLLMNHNSLCVNHNF